jgi:long-chain fatty acid transport protein
MRLHTPARRATAGAACILSALAPPGLVAQGFGLNEIGGCAVARGFATTGAPCEDASTLYWNPAAATRLPAGLAAYLGATAIQVDGRFTADVTRQRFDGNVPVEYPPFAGVTWRGRGAGVAGRLALGVAAYVPYGLTSQWRDDFPGRFAAQKASLQTLYVQPTVALEVVPGRLSLGAGPVLGRSTIEIRQAVDFSAQQVPGQPAGFTFARLGFARGTEFATARIEGTSDVAVGAHLGAHVQLASWLSVGARYLTRMKFDYPDAEATFTQSPRAATYVLAAGNPLGVPAGTTLTQVTAPQFTADGTLRPGQEASTAIEHPAQLQIGIGLTGRPASRLANTTLSADYARTFWDSFDRLPVDFPATASGAPSPLTRVLIEEYEDVSAYRVGLEHRFGGGTGAGETLANGATHSGRGGGNERRAGIAVRLGFSYAESPAPDQTVTPLLPDMDRYNFAGGLGVPLGRSLVLDVAYLRVETRGRRGRTSERPETLTPAETVQRLNDGWFALNANVFSLGLKARF